MKILSTERRSEIANGEVVNSENPAYLYELLQNGVLTQRHNMVLSTILNELAKHELSVNDATPMEAFSFHNLGVSAFGPYILNAIGEQVYTFRNDHTMVKLDPGTQHAAIGHYVKFPKGIYLSIFSNKLYTLIGGICIGVIPAIPVSAEMYALA